MKTLQVSKFKARCLGLLKEIRDTGEPLTLTLRGEVIAVVQPPGLESLPERETVADTLRRLHPLLLVEDEELEVPPRSSRPSAAEPFPDESA